MNRKKVLNTFLVISTLTVFLLAMGGGLVVAEESDDYSPDVIFGNEDDAYMTISEQEQGWGLKTYEDDSGEKAYLPSGFEFDEDVDHPIRLNPSGLNSPMELQDPIKDDSDDGFDWTNSSKWTEGTDADVDVTETNLQDNVDALRISFSNGTNAEANLDDIISDVSKKRFILGVKAVDLTNSVDIDLVDNDGDTVGYELATGKSLSQSVIANETGVSVFDDQKATDLAGSGTMNEFSKIKVSSTGTSEVVIFAIEIDTKRFEFGTDIDGEAVYNSTTGESQYTVDLESEPTEEDFGFAPNFDYETRSDVDVYLERELIPSTYDTDDASELTVDYEYSLETVDAIDVAYSNFDLNITDLEVDGDKVLSATYDNNDITSDLEGLEADDNYMLEETIGKDTIKTLSAEIQQDSEEIYDSEIEGVGTGGVPADDGGIIAWILGIFGTIASALGIKKYYAD